MIIPCWNCGKPATETRVFVDEFGTRYQEPSMLYRCYCAACKDLVDKAEQEERSMYVRLRKREMFRKACTMLEKQCTKMYEYKEAIDTVYDFLEEHPDKFDSSYEVLAAIVLLQNRIYMKMQHKIGKYQVDFLLPDLGVVLEIDGERHKHKRTYDTRRDLAIKRMLGDGWDIIRMPTEYLDKDAKKLPEAIHRVIECREVGRVDWRSLYCDI